MNVLEYIIAFMLLSTAFYLLYRYSFSKLSYFEFNRWYLLATLPLSALLPLIDFNVKTYVPKTVLLEIFYADTVAPTYQKMIASTNSFDTLWIFYGLGFLFMLSYTLVSIFKMFRIREQSIKKASLFGDYYQHKAIQKAFSFFNWVFVNENEAYVDIVCKHEFIHVKKWHSVDKIVLQLFRIVFWFHPILKYYEKAIDETHEYIVDNEISDSIDKNTYANILLGQLMGVSGFPMTSGFSDKSILKRRIMMMNQSKKRSWKSYLLLIPVLMVMLVAVSCTKGTENPPENEQKYQAKLEQKALKANQVDVFPSTANCDEVDEKMCFQKAIMNHLQGELTYPKELQEKGLNDRVYITFVIDKTGKVKDAKVERGGEKDELFRTEALRVVNTIPQFIPAKKDGKAVAMQFAVPIVFKI